MRVLQFTWSVVAGPSSHGLRRMIASKSVASNDTIWNEVATNRDHKHGHHILQSGLRFLKEQENIDAIKRNVQNRGMYIDMDALVRHSL